MKNIRTMVTHPFHLVDVSPWPILMSFGVLSGSQALVNWLTLGKNNTILNVQIAANILFVAYLWFRDIIREGQAGFHTEKVRYGLMLGFTLFMVTEILLFISFFWALFHSSLNPSVEIAVWPPLGVNAIDYMSLPLQNSILLLSGGFVATWGHHSFLQGNKTNGLLGMIIAIVLTLIFVMIQAAEYSMSEFAMADSVYGSTFFALTGLHGFHVLLAAMLLIVATYRMYADQYSTEHALGLDTAQIYYHIVDVIWLALYAIVYYYFGN